MLQMMVLCSFCEIYCACVLQLCVLLRRNTWMSCQNKRWSKLFCVGYSANRIWVCFNNIQRVESTSISFVLLLRNTLISSQKEQFSKLWPPAHNLNTAQMVCYCLYRCKSCVCLGHSQELLTVYKGHSLCVVSSNSVQCSGDFVP